MNPALEYDKGVTALHDYRSIGLLPESVKEQYHCNHVMRFFVRLHVSAHSVGAAQGPLIGLLLLYS